MSRLALLGGGIATPSSGPPPDTTAPVTSGLSMDETGYGAVSITITTDTNEGAFEGVFSTSATPGTGAQIDAGLMNTGAAAHFAFSQAPGGTGARTFSVTSVPPGDNLYLHVTQTDTAGNYATPLTYGPFNLTPTLEAVMAKLNASLTAQDFTGLTLVSWNGADIYDVTAWHDPASNPSRITIPAGVNYVQFVAQLGIQNATANDTFEILLRKNGAAITTGQVSTLMSYGGTAPVWQIVSYPMPVVAGDYFEVQIQVQSDTNVDLLVSRCYVGAMKVG